jgi:hypothetical protein
MLRNINSQKLIIFSIVTFFIASSAWLFYVSEKFADPAYDSAWWGIYFENPKESDLNFIIENHSIKEDFHWEVSSDGQKNQEGSVKIPLGGSQRISIENEDTTAKKTTIRVSDGTETKEIYKNSN